MKNSRVRLYKKNIFFLFLFLFPSLVFGNRISVADYAFEKDVLVRDPIYVDSLTEDLVSKKDIKRLLAIPLDKEVLRHSDERFGNFNVFDENNESLEFSIFHQNNRIIKKIALLEISSQLNDSPLAITDENFTTSFLFNEEVDRENDSWFLVDLGRVQPLNKVEVFVTDESEVEEIEIFGGETADKLEKIYEKKSFNRTTGLPESPQVRYLKISLWGSRIDVFDLRVTSSREAIIYLRDPIPKTVRIFYGGDKVDYMKFEERYSSPVQLNFLSKSEENRKAYMENSLKFPVPIKLHFLGALGKQRWNSTFPLDIDNDGKENKEDNCPFEKNSEQSDKDKDEIGDVCDNAIEKKNENQYDIDGDGIGDIVDNCKFDKNPDQIDSDRDNIGDICDKALLKSNISWKSIFIYIFGLILLGLVIKNIWTLSLKKH